ncbi:MAG: FAD:protein FMN transferase [Hymenobacter sp.]|nr:MAG: FAD:protein FMN transferase [Hymenobacter sp.]
MAAPFPADCRYRFEAIGTQWEIDTAAPLPGALRQRIAARIAAFDRAYSRFRADSLVAQVAAAPTGGRFTFPPDSPALFALYDQLHALTGGAVDPLVGRRLAQLGYASSYSLRPAPGWQTAGPDTISWARDIAHHGPVVCTQRPLLLDVGAAGKGHLVDSIASLVQAAGIEAATVDAGGDMRHFGLAPLRVGLEHPRHPDRVVGVVELHNAALCASATTRRAWGPGLHHVLDARRGRPTAEVLATWVIAPNALTADGLATALFFVEAEVLQPHFSFAAVRMLANQMVEVTANFPGEIFY